MSSFLDYTPPAQPARVLFLPSELVPAMKARLAKKVRKSESGWPRMDRCALG